MEGREWALGDFRKPVQIYSAKELQGGLRGTGTE